MASSSPQKAGHSLWYGNAAELRIAKIAELYQAVKVTVTSIVSGERACVIGLTSSVALVYTAVSFLVNGVYLLLPDALIAAVSI